MPSSASSGWCAKPDSHVHRALSCEIITPLGGPVVPDVYMSVAHASGLSARSRCSSSASSPGTSAESALSPTCMNSSHVYTLGRGTPLPLASSSAKLKSGTASLARASPPVES